MVEGQKLDLTVSSSELGSSRKHLIIKDLSLSARLKKWSYQFGNLLQIECRQVHISWSGTHVSDWSKILGSEGIPFQWDDSSILVRRWLLNFLKDPEVLKGIQLKAQCREAEQKLLRDLVVARLRTLTMEDMASIEAKWDLPFQVPKEFRSGTMTWLSGPFGRVALAVGNTPLARLPFLDTMTLIELSNRHGPRVLALFPLPFEFQASPFMRSTAVELPTDFAVSDFVPFFPQLRESTARKLRVRLDFSACPNPAGISIDANVEPLGRQRLLSLDVPIVFELIGLGADGSRSGRLAQSSGWLRAQLLAQPSDSLWKIRSVVWNSQKDAPCEMSPLPEGLRLSLNWLFRRSSLWEPFENELSAWMQPRHFFVLRRESLRSAVWIGPSF